MKRLRILRRWFERRFGYARLACLALLVLFAGLRIYDPAPVEEIRVRTFDTFQRFDPRKKAVRPVTIVDIDDKSMEKLGQWPWPRTRIADLITELTRLGAVVIAFDAVFSEPDRLNPNIAADTFRNLDEATREKLRLLPSNDQIFADAIKASRVVLGESGLPEEIAALDKTIPVKAEKAGIKSIGIRGLQIPTDNNGQLWVHYARNDASIYVPAINVLEKNVAPDMIAGKLVLIGTSAVGLNDIKTTPVSRAMPGVEIHAQVLESALTGAVISQPIYGIAIEFTTALIFGLLVIAFAPSFGPVTLVALGAAFATGLIGTSWYFYTQHRLLVDFTYPLMSTTAIYLTLIFSSFVREQAQRRQIRSAFGRYLSPALVEQLAQSPEKLVLGG